MDQVLGETDFAMYYSVSFVLYLGLTFNFLVDYRSSLQTGIARTAKTVSAQYLEQQSGLERAS